MNSQLSVHRVRTLLRYLNYSDLRKRKILPDIPMFTKISIGGKFPSLARKIGYSSFGLFMEDIITNSLVYRDLSVEGALKPLNSKVYGLEKYFKPNDYKDIVEMVRSHFDSMPRIQVEWTSGNVQGHPDVVHGDCVYDIKTTGRFNAMRSDTILQLLSYYCLAQMTEGNQFTKIGLILPAQTLILVVDLKEWNWKRFWEELNKAPKLEEERLTKYSRNRVKGDEVDLYNAAESLYVGCHLPITALFNMLVPCVYMKYSPPVQFFVAGRQNANTKVSNAFRKRLQKAVSTTNSLGVFIHSPYTLNMSNPWGNKKRPEDDVKIPWTCKKLIYLLKLGEECGLKGIVVHSGQCRSKPNKAKGLEAVSFVTAHLNMFSSVELIAREISPKCPLLIETPVGDKGEILSDMKEFINFFLSLSPHARERVHMCIDTCHVFAAGYEPDEYVREVLKCGIKIGLIHFNDSYYPKGKKKDAHASVGQGHIGLAAMANVFSLAVENEIPCLRE